MIAQRWVSAAFFGSIVALWGAAAHAADTPVAFDLHYVAPVDSSVADGGAGIALRVGQRFRSESWIFTPELALDYASLGGAAEARIYSALLGARLAYDTVVNPGIFLHGGVGSSSFDSLAAPGMDHTAFTYDAGLFVDIELLPLVNVGAHGSYNQLLKSSAADNGIKWLEVGLHAELVL